MGNLSYPVYISHILISGIIDQYFGVHVFNVLGHAGWRFLNLFAVLFISVLFGKVVEVSINKYRKKLVESRGCVEKFGSPKHVVL